MATAITEGSGYKLATIVLSKKEPFTLEDLLKELKHTVSEENEILIKRSLDRLCDNGIIIKHGSLYSLSINNF